MADAFVQNNSQGTIKHTMINLVLSVFIKDTSACSQEERGIEPLTLRLVDHCFTNQITAVLNISWCLNLAIDLMAIDLEVNDKQNTTI